jgi:hypothetical protein
MRRRRKLRFDFATDPDGRFPVSNQPGWACTSFLPKRRLARDVIDESDQEATMLWTIALVLLVLWAAGLVSSVTMGGFIHLLLVAAIVLVLVRVIQGRRVV